MLTFYRRYVKVKNEKKKQLEASRPLSILDVSYFFLEKSKNCIVDAPYYKTSLYNFVPYYGMNRIKLNILCYHAYCWHLAYTGERFFDEYFFPSYSSVPYSYTLKKKYKEYGWDGIPYGEDFKKHTTFKSVYSELLDFKGYTYSPSMPIINEFPKEKCNEFQLKLLESVWAHYGHHSDHVLRNYIWSDVPFRAAFEDNRRSISDADIMEYYAGNLLKQALKKGL